MWRFHNQNSEGVLQTHMMQNSWCCRKVSIRGRGLNIWYSCENESLTSAEGHSDLGCYTDMAVKQGWAAAFFVNWFCRIGRNNNEKNVGCSSKALAGLDVCYCDNTLFFSSLPYTSFWERRGEWISPACAFCPREDGRSLWHWAVVFTVWCEFLKGWNCFCSKCHDDLPLYFQSLLNAVFSRAVVELDMKHPSALGGTLILRQKNRHRPCWKPDWYPTLDQQLYS